jgi:hypothetical protein
MKMVGPLILYFTIYILPYATGDSVPVYDGRTKVFNVDSKSLDKIDTLPKFVGEVPTGSLIVVAYTAGAYEGNNSVQTLSLNVNWVLLLGSKE